MLLDSQQKNYIKFLPFALIYGVHLIGAFNDVMEIDAAQYAAISWEMSETNNFLETRQRGADYLDKPPLLFWISSISFKLFGYNNFAYRFIPTLLSFLGAYATFRLAKIYYSYQVAYLSALLLASCQAVFLMNQDLRTDNMLTTFVVFSIWQLAAYFQSKKWLYLIGGFVGVGLAMLSKGPIGLVIPILAFASDFAVKRQWANFFKWQYLVGLVVLGLVLLPMSIGLYQQFDLHPEKTVNSLTNVSGLKFFYWTQSFGRITGENVWSNNPDPFFLVHTTLWSFLPWSFFLVIAFICETRDVFKNKFKKLEENKEILLWAGFTLTFIALSRSKYQLNHYIYVVYPFGAIMTAKWIEKMVLWSKKWLNFFNIWLNFQIILLIFLAGVLGFWCFPIENWWVSALIITFFGFTLYTSVKSKNLIEKFVLPSFFAILAVNTLMNGWVYPYLLNNFQTESVVFKKVKANPQKYNLDNLYILSGDLMGNTPDFYAQRVVKHVGTLEEVPNKSKVWIFCDDNFYQNILTKTTNVQVLEKEVYNDFHVSVLTPEFLNPNTRNQHTKKTYLLNIIKN